MTKLMSLFDYGDLVQEMADGYVRGRVHPLDDRLAILNYTEKAQYENHWTDVTRQTRGLIYRTDNLEVLERPFDKFFNVGQEGAAQIDPTAPVEVTDKMDGSLGILYHAPDGLAIATRGSFESEQAIHATALLRSRYAGFVPVPGLTYLFEIIYPENRIVLDYHGRDDLVLLGMRITESGQIVSPARGWQYGWNGPITTVFSNVLTLADALNMANRSNAEGVVIRDAGRSGLGGMVKVKQEDYVRLHKLVTGLNERAVWEHLRDHKGTYGGLLANVPDEFHEWVTQVADGFLDDYETLQAWAHVNYQQIIDVLGPDNNFDIDRNVWGREYRGAFAKMATETLHPALLFHMLDGKDASPTIWRMLKPKGETNSLMNRTEDNA